MVILFKMVRVERLELSRVTPLEPKSSASTNSATLAKLKPHVNLGFGLFDTHYFGLREKGGNSATATNIHQPNSDDLNKVFS
jgi:hypothetical protein